MTLAGIIQSVIDILKQINDKQEKSRIGADSLLYDYFKTHRFVGSKDRKEISRLTWDILRLKLKISYLFGQFNPRQAMLYYLRYVEKDEIESITEIFNGAKYAPTKLEDDEIDFLENFKEPSLPDYVQNNTPEWLWQKVCEVYGNEKNAARQMQSFAESAEIDIIVNPNKASREKLFERLNELEIPAKLSTYSPLGIKILRRVNLLNLPEFQNGHFEIQDEGSQILSIIASQASLSLTNTPAKRVLDYCAGAGGKTLGMAFFMNKETEFVATDLYSVRLKEARMRFYRAGLESQTRILKLEDLSKKYALASFDLIMIDAPCSCLGTMRRAPDIRWRTTQKDVDAICATQAEILPKAASFLKSGGVLIYATCSILHEENEAQIEKFIAANPEFIHLNLSLEKLNDFKDNLGNFRLSPATSGTDGFFASVLKKK